MDLFLFNANSARLQATQTPAPNPHQAPTSKPITHHNSYVEPYAPYDISSWTTRFKMLFTGFTGEHNGKRVTSFDKKTQHMVKKIESLLADLSLDYRVNVMIIPQWSPPNGNAASALGKPTQEANQSLVKTIADTLASNRNVQPPMNDPEEPRLIVLVAHNAEFGITSMAAYPSDGLLMRWGIATPNAFRRVVDRFPIGAEQDAWKEPLTQFLTEFNGERPEQFIRSVEGVRQTLSGKLQTFEKQFAQMSKEIDKDERLYVLVDDTIYLKLKQRLQEAKNLLQSATLASGLDVLCKIEALCLNLKGKMAKRLGR